MKRISLQNNWRVYPQGILKHSRCFFIILNQSNFKFSIAEKLNFLKVNSLVAIRQISQNRYGFFLSMNATFSSVVDDQSGSYHNGQFATALKCSRESEYGRKKCKWDSLKVGNLKCKFG